MVFSGGAGIVREKEMAKRKVTGRTLSYVPVFFAGNLYAVYGMMRPSISTYPGYV